MSSPAPQGPKWRNSPFMKPTAAPSPLSPSGNGRPSSMLVSSPLSPSRSHGHGRQQSFSPLGSTSFASLGNTSLVRTSSHRHNTPTSATFAPQFIKSEDMQKLSERVQGIEGENDFSGKRYVWLKDPEVAFVRGWVVENLENERLLVQCDDGSQREVNAENVDKVNPAKFDKADDMAELTHLNEASVVHNLHMRYQADLIYTYSGLFLVTVNPYCPLPIYTRDYINMYKGRSREDTKPHIFAIADEAFRNLVDEGRNQSILVTGESGAGKTENTKKVIQYLAAVATSDTPRAAKSVGRPVSNLSEQILRANPILESFGNAQTVRNNNSSRFGKFIRIEFTKAGQIAGAYIDWYLLEKSRVVKLNSSERNYHIFYQLLKGSSQQLKKLCLLENSDIEDFEYTRQGNDIISGVSDREEWNCLVEAFHIMGFSDEEQNSILRTVAAVLHLGNVKVVKESLRGDQAALGNDALDHARRVCRLLGISLDPFVKALLHPKVKAGRELVEKVQTPEQVRLAIDALAKGIYERSFGDLVTRINKQLDRSSAGTDDTHFIGVLDIAGFEIFEENSFEQLCINYTNEKLQQFFNHHMFVLEQEEYAREQIEWKFIDFGKDLQPTIDLIELPNPIGIFSCLDEDSVMPKATDKSFTEKLHSLWDRKTPKYRRSLLKHGFMLTHYAAEVEYSTSGWLEKNKDPLNDNVTHLLALSTDKHVAKLFSDCMDPNDEAGGARSRVKKGLFRTVAQRHKEQLSTLMNQLHSTHPHFVRCILPNHRKKAKQFMAPLVLDQLRCNGVLEGIRIARTGFPNRLPFSEFRARYEVLCTEMPDGYLEGQVAARIILEKLNMDRSLYRVGLTKVFFRAGVLAELEERRDALINEIMTRFQSLARGFVQRRAANKRLYRAEATRIIQRNFQVYMNLQENPWWRLFVRMRPLLGATRQAAEVKRRDEMIVKLEEKMQFEANDRLRLEEERRRAEMEIQKVQQTLESERALALDKEEIFRRLQNREAELTDKLAGALEDQEKLENQLDKLMLARKSAEEQAEQCREELDRAGQIITKLEAEKLDLANQISVMDSKLTGLEGLQFQKTQAEESLNQEVKMLTSHLALKERKVQDLEQKLLRNDHDVELRLKTSDKDLQSTKKQLKDMLDENKQIRQQMSDLASTSTSYEDLIRRKESEMAILKTEMKSYEHDRRSFDDEKRRLATRHDSLQSRLREVQAEMEAMTAQQSRLERETACAKKALEERLSEAQGRKMLEDQIQDLQSQLFQVQTELSRERQSRDDVQMLGEHKLTTLKRDYDTLNESKIIIEKEMYLQQDGLRRANEARSFAEKERREYQNELRSLREKFISLQEEKLGIQESAERNVLRQANERQAQLRQELEVKDKNLEDLSSERSRLADEVQGLTQMIADSDNYKVRHDQHKERLERELVTIKGRLAASENDNRVLLNKIQQKNLDIARTNSRAGDSQRTRIVHLTAEKAKAEEENKNLSRQLEEAHLTLNSLEKQKEKLALSLEDLNHEITREHKISRNAEQVSSAINLQLAEANRKLETERQLKTQAQANTRTVQATLDNTNRELSACHQQLMVLNKVFNPDVPDIAITFDSSKIDLSKTADLAQKVETSQQALRIATERASRAESQLEQLRQQFENELTDMDSRHNSSKRAMLEELNHSQINTRSSPVQYRSENRRPISPTGTPVHQRHIPNGANDSARSDKTVDTLTFNNKMDLAAELELVQNQLQMSEMRNRHLQSQIDRSPTKTATITDESPSMRRMQKLQNENLRLHNMLDDSARKLSTLENSIRSGQLTLKDVQTKSYEELYDLINSQEQSRKSLMQSHNTAIDELVDAKTAFDDVKQSKLELEVELRDAKSELADIKYEREQEGAGHAQLLQEFADLQIRLDTETSNLVDATASLNLYKARADDYFNKLEQAEIAVMKATRAEQFAKTQAREAEETCASIISERQQMDQMVEDLQRQTQKYEERIEDVSADLDGALQVKKRLQNELEDYRSQRAVDLEDKEVSMEQTRKKYQMELSNLTSELEVERQYVILEREENGKLRDQIEELRAKWDDEVINSNSWHKEKTRLEITVQDLSHARDEAVDAHNEAQSKVVNLLSQVRNLRTSLDDAVAERDILTKEKKSLESQLVEAGDRLEELARGESPSMRNAATMDRELLELKANLAQQEDIVSAAVGKMRRAEALAQETQKDIVAEREANVALHKEKAVLEKTMKDLQLKLVDLETKGYSSASQDVRFLHGRIQELEKSLDAAESSLNTSARSNRTVDRSIRDLQTQIERRDKQNSSLSDDLNKARDKLSSLLNTIDDLQSSDSANQLAAKRAERELREEKERCLRIERELEGWKNLRLERGSVRAGNTGGNLTVSEAGDVRSRRGSSIGLLAEKERNLTQDCEALPHNKQLRRVSGTKGFL